MSTSTSCKHYDNASMQYSAIFYVCKNGNLRMKNCDFFFFFFFFLGGGGGEPQ